MTTSIRSLTIILGTLFCLLNADSTEAYSPEFSTAGFYQTDTTVREAINFNIGWRFIKRDVTHAEGVDYNDHDWAIVNLPNAMELLPLSASGGVNYQGPSWYRKTFTVDSALQLSLIHI